MTSVPFTPAGVLGPWIVPTLSTHPARPTLHCSRSPRSPRPPHLPRPPSCSPLVPPPSLFPLAPISLPSPPTPSPLTFPVFPHLFRPFPPAPSVADHAALGEIWAGVLVWVWWAPSFKTCSRAQPRDGWKGARHQLQLRNFRAKCPLPQWPYRPKYTAVSIHTSMPLVSKTPMRAKWLW